MEPITLAVVTTAATSLALEATKDFAKDEIKSVWTKVKGLLGFKAEPKTEDLAEKIATALNANALLAEQILAELKATNTSIASKLAAKVTVNVQQTTGPINAGGKVTVVQGRDFAAQGDMNIGGG